MKSIVLGYHSRIFGPVVVALNCLGESETSGVVRDDQLASLDSHEEALESIRLNPCPLRVGSSSLKP